MDRKKIFLWGTGHVATEIIAQYGGYVFEQYEVLGWIDSKAEKQGQMFNGYMIYPPFILREKEYDYLVILVDSNDSIRRVAESIYGCTREKMKDKLFFCEEILMERYKESKDDEIKTILDYVKKRGLHIFNYDFMDEYDDLSVDVHWDKSSGMFFVLHEGKQMYFKKSFKSEKEIRQYYSSLLAEQDKRSPHCYVCDGDFELDDGSVVIDAGAAEGIFSLSYIERISKLYIIETDPGWEEALRQTFREYKDKVIFVNKFLCDINCGGYATLDDAVKEPVDFIKMDIEGSEIDALRGSRKLVSSSRKLKCAVCCYHTDYDEDMIRGILNGYGMNCVTTPGYMWFPYLTKNRFMSDRLHRGVIRAVKG